jgi:diguanylate cyclase (GGDEF)-like protein
MLISFRRNQRELNENLQILSLSHEITTLLQGISSIREIGQRVISTFIERHQWVAGALYEVGGSGTTLHLISTAGDSYATSLMEHFPELQVATTINGAAISSGKIALTHDTETDTRIDPALRQHFTYKKNGTLVVVPLIHDNRPLGTLLLRSDHPRYLTPHEMTLLESVGQVVAMALINARQLAELSFQAAHDSLTGLANRASLHEHIASLAGAEFTLMLFDLDRFKEVNDTLGHGVGDQLLCALAQRLQQTLGSSRTSIFRLGGDEFVVLLQHPLAQGRSRDAAVALLALISAPIVIDDISLRTTASIGVVDTGMHQGDSHELLRCADLAMYEAKQSRSAIACYDAGSDFRIRDKVALLGAVRTALDEQQFVLHYQPKVDLATGACCGCEALIRWHHPERGLLAAGLFMPWVETTDMIQAVTYRVIDRALADIQRWEQRGIVLDVAINLSSRNLYDRSLIDYLLERTAACAIAPERLQLEITETVLMADLQVSLPLLQALHVAGFVLALDDFGTGYSSLSYLSRFPIQVVKIDQSFVRQMARDHRSVDVVEATIRLCQKLGYQVVAEGIEERAEQGLLQRLGCDVGQGYLFAKPMPAADFEQWLGARTDG